MESISIRHSSYVWDDESYLEIPAKILDEPRFLVIGKLRISIGQRLSPPAEKTSGLSLCGVQETRRLNYMNTKASNFDKKFDDGESIIKYLDLSKARRP